LDWLCQKNFHPSTPRKVRTGSGKKLGVTKLGWKELFIAKGLAVSSVLHMRIWVELTGLDGTVDRREVLTASRDTERMDVSGFGLSLEEGKAVLSGLQAELTQFQVDQTSALDRACLGCGSLRGIHDCRHRSVHSLFGVCRIHAPLSGLSLWLTHRCRMRAYRTAACVRSDTEVAACSGRTWRKAVLSRGGAHS
jgi:hypothetical protein